MGNIDVCLSDEFPPTIVLATTDWPKVTLVCLEVLRVEIFSVDRSYSSFIIPRVDLDKVKLDFQSVVRFESECSVEARSSSEDPKSTENGDSTTVCTLARVFAFDVPTLSLKSS